MKKSIVAMLIARISVFWFANCRVLGGAPTPIAISSKNLLPEIYENLISAESIL
jgi:hypothetical protein